MDKNTKDLAYNLQIEKRLKHADFECDKLRRQKKQLNQNIKKASQLFKTTLKVKLQYEELITQLNANAEISPYITKALAEQQQKIRIASPDRAKKSKTTNVEMA